MILETEISGTKLLKFVKEEAEATSDVNFIEKLMKATINAQTNWDEYAIEVSTLNRMIKMCQNRLKTIEG